VALRQDVGIADVLALVADFRRESQLPVVLMTYANPIVRMGLAEFGARAHASGVDGIIVSDLPPEESPETWDALTAAGLDTITLVAPTTEDARVPGLLARCRGFVYCLARTGVTGQGSGWSGSLPDRIAQIRRHTTLPVASASASRPPTTRRSCAASPTPSSSAPRSCAAWPRIPGRAPPSA